MLVEFQNVDVDPHLLWVPNLLQSVPPEFDRRLFARNYRRAKLVVTDEDQIIGENNSPYGRVIAYYHRQLIKRSDQYYDAAGVLRPTGYPTILAVRKRLLSGWVDYVANDEAFLLQLSGHLAVVMVLEELIIFVHPSDIIHPYFPTLVLQKDAYTVLGALREFEGVMRQRAVLRFRSVAHILLNIGAIEIGRGGKGAGVRITKLGDLMHDISQIADTYNHIYAT